MKHIVLFGRHVVVTYLTVCSRNVLYGPDFNDVQRDLALPGVFMASNVDVYNQTTVDDMNKQISVLVLAIERASNILYDDITT